MRRNNSELPWIIGTVVTVILIAVVGWVGFSYFEAKAFNNVTGKNVSTLDAMFIQLRVAEPAE